MKYNGIDVYNAIIADDFDGITFISLVDEPAVERDFVCFNKEKEMVRFSIENEEKRIISGVVMVANLPIYRRQGDYEYYLIYEPETIRKMAQKLLSDGTFRNVDLMHDNQVVKGISLLELYIKDDTKGISPNFVDDVPNGSLMASFHVENDELWNEIKNGDILKGFSLEGYFTIEKMNNNQLNTNNKMRKSKIAKFVKSLVKFGEVETDKAVLYWEGEEELKEGTEVFVGDDTEKTPAEDGEYVWEEKVIVVKDGKVEEIKEKEVEEEKPAEEVEVEAAEEEVVEEEVVETEPEKDENAERINALEEKVAELEAKIAELQAKIDEILATPAVEPIEETFEQVKDVDVKGLPKSAQKALNIFKGRK